MIGSFLCYRKLCKINLAVLYYSQTKQTAAGKQFPVGVARFFAYFYAFWGKIRRKIMIFRRFLCVRESQ